MPLKSVVQGHRTAMNSSKYLRLLQYDAFHQVEVCFALAHSGSLLLLFRWEVPCEGQQVAHRPCF